MKKTYSIAGLIVLGVAAAGAAAVIYKVRRRNMMRRLMDASNEGYEIAHDIIYPEKISKDAPAHVKYGPYIPKYD